MGTIARGIATGLVLGLGSACGAPAQELTPEQLDSVRRGAVSFHVPDSGTLVPLVGRPDIPMIDVRLNGRGPYRFLLDLGSNVVIARRDVIDDAGLTVVVEREGTDVATTGEMTIGEATFHDVWIGSYDELDVDGVIGYNVLRGTGIVLDYRSRTLRLGPVAIPASGADVIPYEVHGRMPYVRGRIGGRDVLMNFDTGASNHVVFPQFLADSLPLEAPPVVGPKLYNEQTGPVRVLVARLAEDIVVGPHVIERPVVLFDPAVEDAWLGSAILTDARLELDTERRVARLTTDRPLASPPYRTLGLSLGPFDEASATREVRDVIPGTPAARLPIVVGDSVASIGGVPAADLVSWRRRSLAAEHDAVDVVLRRDGREVMRRLEVAELP